MKRFDTRKLTGMALMTAIVVVLQLLGSFIRFGTFSISLVLVPIVVGAALYGAAAGGWLGFVFALVVLLSGDASLFMAVSPVGTVLTVMLKGIVAGLGAGVVYTLLKKHEIPAVIAAAVAAPVLNTGIFLLGCLCFFMPTVREWAAAMGFADAGTYMILGLAGGNFLFELLFNIVLSPVIVRLLRIARKDEK
jgi:uncharacterized membrane protein